MKRYSENEIDELVKILKNDGVISVPTDTVYGLCARINSKKAYDKLVKIKNRPANKSFPIMCLNEKQIKEFVIVNEKGEKIIKELMPGPITLILNKKKEAFSYINNKGVAIRMAPLKVLERLLEKTGFPLFLTSANISGERPCNSIEDIENTFPNIDGILEGNLTYGEASTIVDCTKEEINILRKGPITLEEINKALNEK